MSVPEITMDRKPRPQKRDLGHLMRLRYGFVVVGYVVMPEHVHLLVNEPKRAVLGKTSMRSSCRWRYSRCSGRSG